MHKLTRTTQEGFTNTVTSQEPANQRTNHAVYYFIIYLIFKYVEILCCLYKIQWWAVL